MARTVRKDAGTETRPLESILFVNVETNWSISPLERFEADWNWTGQTALRRRRPGLRKWVEEAARIPPWPQRKRCLLPPPHSPNGHIWDNMGYYGRQWKTLGKSGCSVGKGSFLHVRTAPFPASRSIAARIRSAIKEDLRLTFGLSFGLLVRAPFRWPQGLRILGFYLRGAFGSSTVR